MKVTLNFIFVFFLGILIGVLGSGINSKLYIDDSAFSKLLPLKNLVITENNKKIESQIELYLNQKEKNTDMWLTFMTILSTFFAIFFVYSGFKIDDTVNKIEEKYKNISSQLKEKVDEIEEDLTIQKIYSQVTMNAMSSDYEGAIDFAKQSLDQPIVQKSDRLEYGILKLIANTYWIWGENEMSINSSSDNQDFFLNAKTFLQQAMEIEIGTKDEEILSSYEDRYNYVRNLNS